MTTITATYTGAVPAALDALFDRVADFGAIADWAGPLITESHIESGQGVGAVRHIRLGDGRTARELLVAFDRERRTYTYRMLAPFLVPVRRAEVTVQVRAAGAGSQVTWTGSFEADRPEDAQSLADISTHQVWPVLTTLLAGPGASRSTAA